MNNRMLLRTATHSCEVVMRVRILCGASARTMVWNRSSVNISLKPGVVSTMRSLDSRGRS